MPGSTGALENFLRTHRGEAHHFEQASRPAKHDFLLRMANLRLQGIKLLFEAANPVTGEELSWKQQTQILDVYERALGQSKLFKPPNVVLTRPPPSSSSSSSSSRSTHRPTPSPWSPGVGVDPSAGMEPEQPHVPFSQTVSMPEGFSDIFAQIKKHQLREEGQRPFADAVQEELERIRAEEAQLAQGINKDASADDGSAEDAATNVDDTATAAESTASSVTSPKKDNSFESRRSPFSRVATVFSSSARQGSFVDGRGRLVLSLHAGVSGKEWAQFFNSTPALIAAARATQAHHRALKLRERQVAEALGVSDLFAEPALLLGGPVGLLVRDDVASDAAKEQQGRRIFDAEELKPQSDGSSLGCSPSPSYQRFLESMHRDAHLLSSLHHVFPRLAEVTLRVFEVHPVTSREAEGEDEESSAESGDGGSIPPARECFSVDPQLGLLLTPLHASVSDLRDALWERGQECVQIGARTREETEEHAAALLHAKRHLKLRSLTVSPSVTREQSAECAQRLSRVFGSMRDQLRDTSVHIERKFHCNEQDGRISIPWNWG
jgi:hypothetical protein